jgi:acetoin utilization deacetylase AcuC-like enzyme
VRESANRAGYGTPGVSLYVAHPSSHQHDTGPHPENAARLRAIEAALAERDWLGAQRVEAPAAERAQLERVHTVAHVDSIEELSARGGGAIDLDTTAGAGSWEAALHAAGGAAFAAERLLAGDDQAVFCGLRPPGHHAEPDRAMGFCLFNNVAVAATHAIDACGAERVLVLDWDVHHGNGTEEIFAASKQVLYASIHQSPLYPGTGPAEFTGEGEGEGYTVNMPVPPGAGPDDFLALVQHVVVPVARAFEPSLIAISAGYDAHRADPLASCMLDEEAFAEMTASMRDLGRELEAPLLVCLEGGYDPPALAASVVATIEALDGDRAPREAPVGIAAEHLARVGAQWPAVVA